MDINACKGCPKQFKFNEPAEYNTFVDYANCLLKMEKKIMYGLNINFKNSWDEYYFITVKEEIEKFRDALSKQKSEGNQ